MSPLLVVTVMVLYFSVLIIIYRQPNANIIETADRVRALLPQLRASISQAIDVEVVMERTTTIRASLHEVERTLMIGDTTHDLQLAVNAGTPCVAVSYGAHDHEALAECKPLFVAHSTRELHDWLVQHG